MYYFFKRHYKEVNNECTKEYKYQAMKLGLRRGCIRRWLKNKPESHFTFLVRNRMRKAFHKSGLRININYSIVRQSINKNVNRIKNIIVNCLRIRKKNQL